MESLIASFTVPWIICTDANAHHVTWGSGYSDHRGNILSNLAIEKNFSILNNTEPTYIHNDGQYSHIDLTLISHDIAQNTTWKVHPLNYHSNHFPIEINLNEKPEPIMKAKKWKLEQADWKNYNKDIILPIIFLSPSEACSKIPNRIITAATKNIPQSTTGGTKPKHYWWTKDCQITLKKKKTALNN